MELVIVAVIVVVVLALARTWWSARIQRDPASSINGFSRALHAMQPGERPGEGRADGASQAPVGGPEAPSRGVTTSGDGARSDDEVLDLDAENAPSHDRS